MTSGDKMLRWLHGVRWVTWALWHGVRLPVTFWPDVGRRGSSASGLCLMGGTDMVQSEMRISGATTVSVFKFQFPHELCGHGQATCVHPVSGVGHPLRGAAGPIKWDWAIEAPGNHPADTQWTCHSLIIIPSHQGYDPWFTPGGTSTWL